MKLTTLARTATFLLGVILTGAGASKRATLLLEIEAPLRVEGARVVDIMTEEAMASVRWTDADTIRRQITTFASLTS